MKLKSVLTAMTALSAVVSPMAAQAGTTASVATGKISTANDSSMGSRQSTAVRGKEKADAGTYVLIGGAVLLAGYGVSQLLDDNKSNGS